MNTAERRPRASIIIIAYNDETHIERAIKSACTQTVNEIEIICVDDGSTDSTYHLMLKNAGRDKRIRVITQQNSGIIAARCAGIRKASGTYTLLIDSDDTLVPNAVKTACDAAEELRADVLEYGVQFVEDSNHPPKKETMDWLRQHFSMERPLPKAVNGADLINACFADQLIPSTVWNKLYKTELLQTALKYYRGEWVCMLEDMLITLMVFCYTEHYARICETLYVHYVGGGISSMPEKISTPAEIKNAATIWMPLRLAQEWLENMEYPQEPIDRGLKAYADGVRGWAIHFLVEKCVPECRNEYLEWLSQCCTKEEFFGVVSEIIERLQEQQTYISKFQNHYQKYFDIISKFKLREIRKGIHIVLNSLTCNAAHKVKSEEDSSENR